MTWRQRFSLFPDMFLCVPLTCWAWDCSQALTNCFSSAREREEAIRLCEFAEALNVWDLVLFLAPLSQTSSVLAHIDVWSRAVYRSSISSSRERSHNTETTLPECSPKHQCFPSNVNRMCIQSYLFFNSFPSHWQNFRAIHIFTVIQQGAILHIFWNGTEFLGPKIGEEEAETSDRGIAYKRKLTQS